MVTDKVLTYDEAVAYCRESHGGLVAIDTKEKQGSFETFIKSKFFSLFLAHLSRRLVRY